MEAGRMGMAAAMAVAARVAAGRGRALEDTAAAPAAVPRAGSPAAGCHIPTTLQAPGATAA